MVEWAVRGRDASEKSNLRKQVHQRPTYQTVTFQLNLKGKMGRKEHFFKVKKGENPHISFPNWPGRLIFEYVVQLWVFYRLAQKQTIFVF